MSYTIAKHADRQSWLLARRSTLGSSDSAAVLGLSRWQSPYSVWWAKCGDDKPDSDIDDIIRWGHLLEPVIAAEFERKTGIALTDPGDFTIYTSVEYPWLSCTPDRVGGVLDCVVELKTAHFRAGQEWGREVPIAYMMQVQHQMLVLGCDLAFIAVLIDGYQFAYHEVKRHDKAIAAIIKRTGEFWRSFVETATAPPPDYSKATSDALAARYMNAKPGVVELPDDMAEVHCEWDRLTKAISTAQKRKDEMANRIKAIMGESTVARCFDGSGFGWSAGEPRRFTRKVKVYDE